ncbi:PEBP-like protein [Sistotremastrum niveocremeum HHB9708]|uniref:PEBP-like protein n=1 Tax=Sistotremastrum niveocremeum HHB9708 TaxID=1314777 RepID=A0A164QTK5_9AGAM|nr:PEBP-like protein [Sistotremastrum niveocremeum HHB9708]
MLHRLLLCLAGALALNAVCVSALVPRFRGTPAQAKAAFIRAKLVPDVLSSFNPIFTLGVTFHFDGLTREGNLGTNIPRSETANRPTWSVSDVSPGFEKKTFVVAMVDPDAPTPQDPTVAQIRHFLGGGFKLENGVLVNTTAALSNYLQPTPPDGSDPHRYTFLLFEQPTDFPTSLTTPISGFNISAFAEQFKFGPPLAGNFITVSANKTTS